MAQFAIADECTNEKLQEFAYQHFTYINQIFGDQTVREIITEVFPNKKFQMGFEETNLDFENSYHHYLIDTKTQQPICSVDNGYQNIYINKNDNLCQSYSLLTYFKIPIDPDQKQRQLDMIKMYRKILSSKKFLKIIDEILKDPDNKSLWINYTKKKKTYLVMNIVTIVQNINDVLNKWEKYGYWYFIGDGMCPVSKPVIARTSKPVRVIGGNSKTTSIRRNVYSRKIKINKKRTPKN